MSNKKITDEQIIDVYQKFKNYFQQNRKVFFEKNQANIVEDIKRLIKSENIYDWNDTSLTDYLNNLVYMVKGKTFARTINKFSKKYFTEQFCKDFEQDICNNVKRSILEHEKYYKKVLSKNKSENSNETENKQIDIVSIKNIILYGSPGVGKTHNINKLISLIEAEKNIQEVFQEIKQNKKSEYLSLDEIKERVEFVTFHQSFGYEDFIEGFRPNEEGNIHLESGIFKRICEDAETDKAHNYYLIIDEINRGNISKIFGELITLIEEDKRDKLEVTLPYSKEPFKVPSNLYIIGTMNSTDKSIALIDIALRRRFTFLKMEPNAELIDDAKAKKIFVSLNAYISEKLGEEYQIGHSYFMGESIDLDFVLEYKIKPLLEEYFYGDIQGLEEVEKIIGEI